MIKKTVDLPKEGPYYEYGRFMFWCQGPLRIPAKWFSENGIRVMNRPPWFIEPQDKFIFLDYLIQLEKEQQQTWPTMAGGGGGGGRRVMIQNVGAVTILGGGGGPEIPNGLMQWEDDDASFV